ncbi:hypothetical protein CMV_019158 [Castanea mollissima]|uniref:Uncharacterized protein n=1 Tax=Castanea mollissima TaxID=60419 RepID=A0A8J4QQN6_9ROSI|nr:hypothetical protein CMV_019158 [Castanea mollissima]
MLQSDPLRAWSILLLHNQVVYQIQNFILQPGKENLYISLVGFPAHQEGFQHKMCNTFATSNNSRPGNCSARSNLLALFDMASSKNIP